RVAVEQHRVAMWIQVGARGGNCDPNTAGGGRRGFGPTARQRERQKRRKPEAAGVAGNSKRGHRAVSRFAPLEAVASRTTARLGVHSSEFVSMCTRTDRCQADASR